MIYAQTNICPENDTHGPLWDFDIQMDHLISARLPDPIIINKKKKENFQILDLFSRQTTEKNWKKDKRRINTSNLKKLQNLKVTILPIVISTKDQ